MYLARCTPFLRLNKSQVSLFQYYHSFSKRPLILLPVISTAYHAKPSCYQSFSRSLTTMESLRSKSGSTPPEPGKNGDSSTSFSSSSPPTGLSRQAKLKRAMKDYGSTVLVFHITMSLCSLGIFYLLVSSGLDMVGLLGRIGVEGSILQSKITQGASTFVVAYAVHKVFAPVRITITLTATPLIVKKLRSMGILKTPTSPK